MSRVIEILDSSDEEELAANSSAAIAATSAPKLTPYQPAAVPNFTIFGIKLEPLNTSTDDNSTLQIQSPLQQPQLEQLNINLVSNDTAAAATDALKKTQQKNSAAATNITATSAAPNVKSIERTRSRKSAQHNVRSLSPGLQFETIMLDDDDELSYKTQKTNCEIVNDTPNTSNNINQTQPQPQQQNTMKVTPNILATKLTFDQTTENITKQMLNDLEVKRYLKQIAEERIRINFLLAANHMPDIQFSLYTAPERLKFQFNERLKTRRLMSRKKS